MRISPTYDGERLFNVRDGGRTATPLLVVNVMIGVVDVIFAVDSIPAIFAITLGATACILVATMLRSLAIPPRTEPAHPGTSSLAGAPAAKLRKKS